MKVLFIGHYKEQSGWGRAACEYILALDEAGVDVVCRPVILKQTYDGIPNRIKQLEKKSTDGCNICIQCVLPHLLFYNGNFEKNICIPFIDTKNLKEHPWIPRMELFEIWSPYAELCVEIWRATGEKPRIVGVPCDPSKYMRTIEPFKTNIDLGGSFKFYSIFDMNPRKNLVALLQAFHLEFKPYEDVQLILKTSKAGKSPMATESHVMELNRKVCESLKLYKTDQYKAPIVIADNLTDEQIDQLHMYGDCFVLPTHGEAWCFPAFDAMAFGKYPIVTEGTSCNDYIHEDTGYLIPSYEVPVNGMTDTFLELFTGREVWVQPDIVELRHMMRWAFGNLRGLKPDEEEINDTVNSFSREIVGNKMKELLCTPR